MCVFMCISAFVKLVDSVVVLPDRSNTVRMIHKIFQQTVSTSYIYYIYYILATHERLNTTH